MTKIKNLKLYGLMLLCGLMLVVAGCGQSRAEADQPSQEPTVGQDTETAQKTPAQNKEPLVNLTVCWGDSIILPGQVFGDITDSGADTAEVCKDGDPLGVFVVRSEDPELLSVEATMSRLYLKKLNPFEGNTPGFTITYKGNDYTFYCTDDSWAGTSDPGKPDTQAATPSESLAADSQSNIALREYTDAELRALVDAELSFEEACEKLSTVSDAIQYLCLRGYHFAPDDAGIEASTRYRLNSGGCVGGSALFNALLEGDYDAQGYVYIFYARGEHVINYYVLDGTYYFCDFVTVFHESGTRPELSPVCHITTDPATIYEAWLEIEPNDLNDSTGDMYLAAMYTTAYCGNPTMPRTWLRDSQTGKWSDIPLSPAEKESQQILFIRDGYTFEF